MVVLPHCGWRHYCFWGPRISGAPIGPGVVRPSKTHQGSSSAGGSAGGGRQMVPQKILVERAQRPCVHPAYANPLANDRLDVFWNDVLIRVKFKYMKDVSYEIKFYLQSRFHVLELFCIVSHVRASMHRITSLVVALYCHLVTSTSE